MRDQLRLKPAMPVADARGREYRGSGGALDSQR